MPPRPTPRRLIVPAILVAAIMAGGAGDGPARTARLPDAELFATNNTAVITDPDDPRLNGRLRSFERVVRRIISTGGGKLRRSRLLEGVFFSSELQTTTFERSRDFDVDGVTPRELHDVAERVRRRFCQQAVLTFDYPERPSDPRDGLEIELPGVDAQRLRDGLAANREARERLVGGSLTLDGRLVLIADRSDLKLAKRFVTDIGGDLRAATIRSGHREFVG